jgi:hypothetical protein
VRFLEIAEGMSGFADRDQVEQFVRFNGIDEISEAELRMEAGRIQHGSVQDGISDDAHCHQFPVGFLE